MSEWKPVIVVAGLGRCGTSMVMQMLAAGGISCVGRAPAYEDDHTVTCVDAGWFETLCGQAVKILDPQRVGIPAAQWEARVIIMERRLSEQAKSIAKMLRQLERLPIRKRQITLIEKGLRSDTRAVHAAAAGLPQLRLQFEEVLATPADAAAAIATFIAPWFDPDQQRMASVVRKRSPQCLPDMAMEMSLIRDLEATA